MWLAISSLPRTSYAGSVYEASSAKLASHRLVRCAPGLDVGKHHIVQGPLVDAHPFYLPPSPVKGRNSLASQWVSRPSMKGHKGWGNFREPDVCELLRTLSTRSSQNYPS